MATGFRQGFADWLQQASGHRVVVVERATPIEPGVVYLAGDDRHLEFLSRTLLSPSDGPERRAQRPSVNVLFESAAARFGSDALAVLLTGMGNDGAEGMAALRRAGAFTIAQEPSTCAVDAMPASAIDLRAAQIVATPAEIVHLVNTRAHA
jgi:two-component system chemotaxis response regulator CheB